MSDFTGKLGTLIVACALLALPRVASPQDRPAEKAPQGKPAEKPSPAAKKNVDPEAARKGFNEGASGVFSEAAEDPLNQAGDGTVRKEKIGLEKSGRWESETSDDF